jgi:Flp pilus assembly protein TadG
VTASRRRPEDGAALVEFALVLPVLASLLVGIFSGGAAFNQKLALASGVREGSRYGATLPVSSASCVGGTGTLACWLTNVADVAIASSERELDPTVTGHQLCVAYVYPSGTIASDRTTKLVRTASGDSVSTGGTCFDDGRSASERRVQVSASRPGRIDFVFGSMSPTLRADSATRFEAT